VKSLQDTHYSSAWGDLTAALFSIFSVFIRQRSFLVRKELRFGEVAIVRKVKPRSIRSKLYKSNLRKAMKKFAFFIWDMVTFLINIFILADVLGPLASLSSGLISNYGSYRQPVGLLGRGISLSARLRPTQDNTNYCVNISVDHNFKLSN
jgi:hypothetical protein